MVGRMKGGGSRKGRKDGKSMESKKKARKKAVGEGK